jgi:hypothetical protein
MGRGRVDIAKRPFEGRRFVDCRPSGGAITKLNRLDRALSRMCDGAPQSRTRFHRHRLGRYDWGPEQPKSFSDGKVIGLYHRASMQAVL